MGERREREKRRKKRERERGAMSQPVRRWIADANCSSSCRLEPNQDEFAGFTYVNEGWA